MGKMVAFWNPLKPGAGSTTLAISVVNALAWWGYRKTLLINCAGDLMLEHYISDMPVKYSLDFLKVLSGSLHYENLDMFVTAANSDLDIIGGFSSQSRNSSTETLLLQFLEQAAEKYDFVVLDLSNAYSRRLLKQADILLPVCPFHPEKLREAGKNKGFLREVESHDTVFIFNKLDKKYRKGEQIEPLSYIKQFYPVGYDERVYNRTCLDPAFYQFLVKEFNKREGRESDFTECILDIAFAVMELSGMKLQEMETEKRSSLFARCKQFIFQNMGVHK